MNRWAGVIGMFVGSTLGGLIGGEFGTMSMWMLSAVGAGVGLYYGRKLLDNFLD